MRCVICNKIISQRGRPNKSNFCSGCRNDCLNGSFGNIQNNINISINSQIEFLEYIKRELQNGVPIITYIIIDIDRKINELKIKLHTNEVKSE